MSDMTTIYTLLWACADIRDSISDGELPRYGLCNSILERLARRSTQKEHVELILKLLDEEFKKWPEFSGNQLYPVPGLKGTGYADAVRNGTMYTGEYGAARLRLLDFIINDLRGMSNEAV